MMLCDEHHDNFSRTDVSGYDVSASSPHLAWSISIVSRQCRRSADIDAIPGSTRGSMTGSVFGENVPEEPRGEHGNFADQGPPPSIHRCHWSAGRTQQIPTRGQWCEKNTVGLNLNDSDADCASTTHHTSFLPLTLA